MERGVHQAHSGLTVQGREGVAQGPPGLGDPHPVADLGDFLGPYVPAMQLDPGQRPRDLHGGHGDMDLATIPPFKPAYTPQPRCGLSGYAGARPHGELGSHGQATQPFRAVRGRYEATHGVGSEVRA